ncbi:sn-glycerol-3-phosphate transporter [Citrobacter freundii]|nr:sn-glycerol-3-phosphate transporter [Citrobacter freundii]
MPEEKVVLNSRHTVQAPENMSAFQIFCTYVLRNKNAWYVSLVDVFVYMVRFGMISWLPIYLLTEKHFSKEQMSIAFLFFEWAAIPSTLLAGWLTDKLFKGRRMPLAMICMALIFVCLIGYWKSESLLMVTIFAAIVGCLIYVPQFLASVQTMEIVPQLRCGVSGRFTRIYELHFWRVAGNQPVWRNGRQNGMAWRILSVDGWDCLLHPVLLPLSSWRAGARTAAKKCSARGSLTPVGGCPVIHFALTKKCQRCWHFNNSDK